MKAKHADLESPSSAPAIIAPGPLPSSASCKKTSSTRTHPRRHLHRHQRCLARPRAIPERHLQENSKRGSSNHHQDQGPTRRHADRVLCTPSVHRREEIPGATRRRQASTNSFSESAAAKVARTHVQLLRSAKAFVDPSPRRNNAATRDRGNPDRATAFLCNPCRHALFVAKLRC